MVNFQTQKEVLCDSLSSKILGFTFLYSLYVFPSLAILFQSTKALAALGLKTFLEKGHRGILNRYCQTAESPECLQSHLLCKSFAIVF